jgi:DNA excision repair protein ERCC-2
MKVLVDDLEVLFPYDTMYKEQFEYMLSLKACLGKGHCVLEVDEKGEGEGKEAK